jgi:transposase
LEAKLQNLASKLGRRPYLTSAAVEKRVTALLAHHPARRFLSVTVGTTEHGPTLSWQRQEAELAAAATLDGRYVAGTTALDLDATTMLTDAKGRDVPEKGYARLKGPLAIRPVFLHKQERILALIFCTMVALLVFSLLELLVRRAGLTVSGPALLAQFAPLAILTLVFNDHSQLRRLTGLAPPIRAVLEVLGWADLQRYTAVPA